MKLIAEIKDKRGHRLERLELNAGQSVGIGRAWSNELVIGDKFVDPNHLRLQLNANEQGVEILKLKATSGFKLSGKDVSNQSVSYLSGDVIRIGDALIRIFDVEQPVVAAVARSSWFGLREAINRTPVVVGLSVAALGLTILSGWAFSPREYKMTELFESISSVLIMILLWGLLFGLLNKIVKGSSHFKIHWALACIALIALQVGSLLLSILLFNLQNVQIGIMLSNLVYGLLVASLVFASLTIATYLANRSKAIVSVLLVLVVISVVYSDQLFEDERTQWSNKTSSEQAMLPPAFMWRDTTSVDTLLAESDDLFEFEE